MFWDKLGYYINLSIKQLKERYDFQKTALKKQFPLLMSGMWNGSEKLNAEDTMDTVKIENTDGTTTTETVANNTYSKEIELELDKEYRINIESENGAKTAKKISVSSITNISNVGEFVAFRDSVNRGLTYEGATINLIRDIDLSSVCGENVKDKHHRAMEKIGFVSEDNIFLEKRTALQNAGILGILYDDFDIELFKQYMKRMGASVNTAYDRMSRGERMKFQLAFAIAHKSKLYLLDEATAGMDSVFCTELFDILRNLLVEECCVLMTSHNMSEIEKQTDYVAIMKNGSIGGFKESMEVSVNSHEENRL